MKAVCFILITVMSFAVSQSYGQKKSKKNGSDSADYVLGLDYQSDNIFSGRRDSVRTSYYTASIGYYRPSGFYLKGWVSYQPSESRVDVLTLDAGYSFNIRKLNGDILLSKSFYNRSSYNVKAEIPGMLSTTFSYDNHFLTPVVTGFVTLGKFPDVGISAGVEKVYYALDDNLTITPSFYINASSQNFYNSYYEKRRFSDDRKGKKTDMAVTGNISGASSVKVQDFQFSLPLAYSYRKFNFSLSPGYDIPVNASEIILKAKSSSGNIETTAYNEKLRNIFSFTIGARYAL